MVLFFLFINGDYLMLWINNFDLFLFDFDGLLVNTEHIHYQAYVNMLKNRGLDLDWGFEVFCSIAHSSQEGLRIEIYSKFPQLFEMQPRWEVLYEEKKKAYFDLISGAKVELMPGVEKLLLFLKESNKLSCVVTNSLLDHARVIIGNNPILKNIDYWITREDYLNPKPDPECYLRAIQLYGKTGDKIVGFEDTIKGINALCQTPAKSVLVCASHHPQEDILLKKGVVHFESFDKIPDSFSF